jgi:hypothetical protein
MFPLGNVNEPDLNLLLLRSDIADDEATEAEWRRFGRIA